MLVEMELRGQVRMRYPITLVTSLPKFRFLGTW